MGMSVRAESAAVSKKSIKPATPRYQWIGYMYLLPMALFLAVFIFWGIIYNFYISFYEWDGISDKLFAGFDNYIALLQDPKFYESLRHTLLFMVICIPGSMLLGLIFSICLHGATIAFKGVFKSIFFLPHVIAIVTIGVTFQAIYEPNFGLLNTILRTVGLDALTASWLADPTLALYAICAAYIFSHVGFYMLIYYTSLLNIDQEVFEAARIDGASVFRQFKDIVFPLLSGTHVTLLILGVIAALKVFDIVWIMTEGGPGSSTELLSTFLFREALLEYKTGYSAAISVILLLIAMVYTAVQLRIYDRLRRSQHVRSASDI